MSKNGDMERALYRLRFDVIIGNYDVDLVVLMKKLTDAMGHTSKDVLEVKPRVLTVREQNPRHYVNFKVLKNVRNSLKPEDKLKFTFDQALRAYILLSKHVEWNGEKKCKELVSVEDSERWHMFYFARHDVRDWLTTAVKAGLLKKLSRDRYQFYY